MSRAWEEHVILAKDWLSPARRRVETIVCANHPSRRASLTCERCGSYACSDCAVDAPWGASVCVPCKARGGLCYPLLWERGNPFSPLCFARSAKAIVLDAPSLFANLPRGSLVRALGFSSWVVLCLTVTRLLADITELRFDVRDPLTQRALSLYGLSQLARHGVQTYGLVLVSALGFHALARGLGGSGSAALAVRAAAYGSVFLLFNAWSTLASTLAPYLTLASLIVSVLIQSYLYFSCLCTAATEHYGVSRARAELVAGATVGMLIPAMFGVTLLTGVLSQHAAHVAAWLWH
jgi:hypothetical protein